MRKLKLQVQISIDGFIAGMNGEIDWVTFQWSDDIKKYVDLITQPVDTILLGKNLAMGFIPHWAAVAEDAGNPEQAAGITYTQIPKIVFSKTWKETEWKNTEIEQGDFVERIKALKSQKGNDIITYGGVQFVSSLIKEKLIDELHLFVNPTILGRGKGIFQDINEVQQFQPVSSQHFDCGIIVLVYQLKPNE